MNKIILAARFAQTAHAAQKRKGGSPYISHPARVATRVMLLPWGEEWGEEGAVEDAVCAAWLHDVVEDCGISYQQITTIFGPVVGGYVDWLTNKTKGSQLPRAHRKLLDRDRLRFAPVAVKRVKLLDRIDNVNELIGCFTPEFIGTYLAESSLLLGAIGDADDDLARELRDSIERVVKQQ